MSRRDGRESATVIRLYNKESTGRPRRVKTQERNPDRVSREKRREVEENIQEVLQDLGIHSFKREYRKLRTMAGEEDFASPKMANALQRAQLAMLINALPVMEANLHKWRNEKASKALVDVSSHIREIVHDLLASGGPGEQIEKIRDVVIQTSMRALAATVIQDLIRTRQDIVSGIKNPETMRKIERSLVELQESLATSFSRAESDASSALERILKVK